MPRAPFARILAAQDGPTLRLVTGLLGRGREVTRIERTEGRGTLACIDELFRQAGVHNVAIVTCRHGKLICLACQGSN